MLPSAHYLMTDPACYGVRYRINPWMRPEVWSAHGVGLMPRAAAVSRSLGATLVGLGAQIAWVPAVPDLPDLVFPANAAVVLDGRALLARFRFPQRQGEEPVFHEVFEDLVAAGFLSEVGTLPRGCVHEGAGDALWDNSRNLFWAGWGQRSDRHAAEILEGFFIRPAVALELANPRFYHLDTCLCPLAGGAVIYYPPAFTKEALQAIRDRVAPDDLIEASDAAAAAFCVNAVSLGRDVVMASAPPRLAMALEERGYRIHELDFSPFILSGGAAFCMTLRLDLKSRPKEASHGSHPRAYRLT